MMAGLSYRHWSGNLPNRLLAGPSPGPAADLAGVDRLPALLAEHRAAFAGPVDPPESLLSTMDAVPSYHLRYCYAHDEVVRAGTGQPTRGQRVAEIEATLREL